MTDDLFTPTIHERPTTAKPPWRPESIFYPAFFGGPLAAAILGLLNGRRLGLGRGPLVAIAATGLGTLALRLAIGAAVGEDSPIRFMVAVSGVLTWLVVFAYQRRPFRAFTYRGGEAAGLFGPGLLAAVGCVFFEAILLLALGR
jgi:hypothetical protein